MNKSIKCLLIIFTLTAFTGCSSLGGLGSLFGKKPQIEVNANVGKNVKQNKSQVQIETGKTEQTADHISNDTAYTAQTVNQLTQNIPPYIILLLVLGFGWLIPDPLTSYRGFKFLLYDITQSFFVVPGLALLKFFRLIPRDVPVNGKSNHDDK